MRPGPYSKVTSPIRVNAIISPGQDGYVYYDLIGEDSRIITHQEMDLRRSIGARFEINEKIPFSINGVAESARLVTYVKDEFGRISFLSSCDIILLSMGEDDYQLASIYQEPFIIRSPENGDSIQGGLLHVNGLLRPVNSNPVIIEVVDESINVLAKTEIQLPFPSGDLSHAPFDISIPYQISRLTPVSIIFRQESQTRLPGTVALSSLRIVLEP